MRGFVFAFSLVFLTKCFSTSETFVSLLPHFLYTSTVSSNYTGTFASQELPVENPLYFSFVIGLSPTSINGNNLFTIS